MRLRDLYPLKDVADISIEALGAFHGITLIFSEEQAANAFVAAIAAFTENQVQLNVVNGRMRSTAAVKQVYVVRTTAVQEAIILARQVGSTPAAEAVQEKVTNRIDTLSQTVQGSAMALEENDRGPAATGRAHQSPAIAAYGLLLGRTASPAYPVNESTPILLTQRIISFSEANRSAQSNLAEEQQESFCARCHLL
jgi:hypothetical protein